MITEKTYDFHKQNQYQEAIGALLKAHREHKNLNQRDIARALNYKSINYISILEGGKSNIPMDRLKEIMDAYQMNSVITPILVRYLHPDVWNLFMAMLKSYPSLQEMGEKEMDKDVRQNLIRLLKEYGIGKYTDLFK
jgi:transcriptional regulator with XRE-family HTH domain